MKNKIILITGANGFLGGAVCKHLKKIGYAVIPAVRQKSGLEDEIILDLAADDLEAQLAKLPSLGAIIHLAARVDFSSAYAPEIFKINTLATRDLAKLAARHNAHFIFSSTIAVYGSKIDYIDSASAFNPDTPYALSKWLAEELIKKECPSHTLLRLPGIYGRNGPPHLGLNKAIAGALNGEPLVLVGGGNTKRNYLFVEDAASIIGKVLEKEVVGTFVCGGPENLPVKEMLESVRANFTPGKELLRKEGAAGFDQIVKPSSDLFTGKTLFKDAIKDLSQL